MKLDTLYQFLFTRSALVRSIGSKTYYQLASPFLDTADFLFMNYGYADLGVSPQTLGLNESDELHRLPIQLYHHLASALDLEGKEVLEVSCGRGGGAAFLARYHRPRSLVGIDRTYQAIAYCQRKHRRAGLSFLLCNAEALGFANECFDVVVNVEASHLYGHADIFLREARRVLRQGGYLLLADKRMVAEIHLFRRQFSECGFQVVSECNISANVLEAIRQQQAARTRILHDLLPRHVAWLAIHVLGADGSQLANAIAAGRATYLSLVLHKA